MGFKPRRKPKEKPRPKRRELRKGKGLAHLAAGFEYGSETPLCGLDLAEEVRKSWAQADEHPGYLTYGLTDVTCKDCRTGMPPVIDRFSHKIASSTKALCGIQFTTEHMRENGAEGMLVFDSYGIGVSCPRCLELQPERVCMVDISGLKRHVGLQFDEPPFARWKKGLKTVCGGDAQPTDVSVWSGDVTCRQCLAVHPHPTHYAAESRGKRGVDKGICGRKVSPDNPWASTDPDQVDCIFCLAVLEASPVSEFVAGAAIAVLTNRLLVGRKIKAAQPLAAMAKSRKVAADFDSLASTLGVPRLWLESLEAGWRNNQKAVAAYPDAFKEGRKLARKYVQ